MRRRGRSIEDDRRPRGGSSNMVIGIVVGFAFAGTIAFLVTKAREPSSDDRAAAERSERERKSRDFYDREAEAKRRDEALYREALKKAGLEDLDQKFPRAAEAQRAEDARRAQEDYKRREQLKRDLEAVGR